MIIARAPYRISFAGGGTDLPAFYRHEPGAVLSTTIDRYVYVSVHPAFGRLTRVNHRVANGPLESLVERAMSLVGVHEPLEIGVVSDLPSGTGMGGSGALSAALLVGLHSFVRRGGGGTSGEEVHRLESQVCESVGQQDGCAAAYGGFNHMEFHTDGTGTIHSIHAEAIADLERHCLLCYTGQQRDAGPILEEQARIGPDSDQFELLRQMAAQVRIMRGLLEAGRIQSFADGVSVGWYAKSCLARGITNPNIDAWYETALRNGAWGAKICGAGGGGFMLLIAPPEKHRDILEALQRPQTVPVKFNTEGAKVIFDDRA